MSKPLTVAQAKAIRNMLLRDRARWKKPDLYTVRDFPKWKPGMTTADYVRLFSIGRSNALPFDLSRLNRPAPFYSEPDEVQFELVKE